MTPFSWIYDYLGTDVSTIETYQQRLFQYVKEVYDTGARNFLFIEVPPIERAPGCESSAHLPVIQADFAVLVAQTDTKARAQCYRGWNSALHLGVSKFTAAYSDVTTMVFPAYEMFHETLDKPADYGLDPSTVNEADGSVWFDAIHITSQMHRVVADALLKFLQEQTSLGEPGV